MEANSRRPAAHPSRLHLTLRGVFPKLVIVNRHLNLPVRFRLPAVLQARTLLSRGASRAVDYFSYRQGQLYCEDLPVSSIVSQLGTPLYIYSLRTISHHFERLKEAFREAEPLICYSLKANSTGAILRHLVSLGAGFDVVSGGELFRALRAGADPSKVVFAGVGKCEDEIEYALSKGILMFNSESEPEIELIDEIAARRGSPAPVALRLNPDVDPLTHIHITTGKKENKFGMDLQTASHILERRSRFQALEFLGVHFHIGSQITEVAPYISALNKVVSFINRWRNRGVELRYLDAGGGFGIHYHLGEARPASEFAQAMLPIIKESGCRLIIEPGRFIVGNAGILVTKVLYVKKGAKNFAICDSGMNHLIRPSLYGAYHRIWPVKTRIPEPREGEKPPGLLPYDVVGPICESADFFAKDRLLPPLQKGTLLAVFSAGAYGMSMSSNYNSRLQPPEVVVEGEKFRLARRRQTYDAMVSDEI